MRQLSIRCELTRELPSFSPRSMNPRRQTPYEQDGFISAGRDRGRVTNAIGLPQVFDPMEANSRGVRPSGRLGTMSLRRLSPRFVLV
jgi:hypothetical protein